MSQTGRALSMTLQDEKLTVKIVQSKVFFFLLITITYHDADVEDVDDGDSLWTRKFFFLFFFKILFFYFSLLLLPFSPSYIDGVRRG